MLFSENMLLVGTNTTTIYESNVSVACVLPVTAQRFGRYSGGKDINLRCDLEPQYGEVIPCFNMHGYVCWKHTYVLGGNLCRGHAQLLVVKVDIWQYQCVRRPPSQVMFLESKCIVRYRITVLSVTRPKVQLCYTKKNNIISNSLATAQHASRFDTEWVLIEMFAPWTSRRFGSVPTTSVRPWDICTVFPPSSYAQLTSHPK